MLDQRTVLCGGMGRTLRLSMPEQLRNISAAGRIAVRVCVTQGRSGSSETTIHLMDGL